MSSYRTRGASKATPAFDVIDYGQEDYVFGSSARDARHWSVWVLKDSLSIFTFNFAHILPGDQSASYEYTEKEF